jgi:hypothetical protein
MAEDRKPPFPSDAHADIGNRFTYHAPSPEKIRAHERVRQYLGQMAHELEEAMFWANAAIARSGD